MTSGSNTTGSQSSRIDLNRLIAETALKLMPASLDSAGSLSNMVLAHISTYFDVEVAFYRRHDLKNRCSILVAEWPERKYIPDPDPLAVLPFDSSPVIAFSEHMKEPAMLVPGDHKTEAFQEMIAEITGYEKVTAIYVPLLVEDRTEGILGLIRDGNCAWSEEEVFALQSIAAMFMQTQSRLRAEYALREAAFRDSLTQLPNLMGLREQGQKMMSQGHAIAVIHIDIVELRTVNKTLGRRAGDKLIEQFATELSQQSIGIGCCGRITGNGFALVMRYPESDTALIHMAEKLHKALSTPIEIGERPIVLNLRIGISQSANRHVSAYNLFEESSAAIRSIGPNSNSTIVLFNRKLSEQNRAQIDMEIALQEAIASSDQLIVHYQPEVDLSSGKLVGCEALVRWQHPSMGLLTAARFIELAENSGLVVPLSRYVLDSAIAQQAQWMREDPELQTTIRINVSPAQLMGTDLAAEVMTLLSKHALPPRHLCIEVTEHVVMDYSEQTLGTLAKLRELGVEVAIDDFGIGHSSIAKLKYMPADTLKIDRAFITSIVDTDRDRALVSTIIRMAMAFDMTVVAEGVETPDELAELLPMEADRAQGYLFAKPMPAQEVCQLFHQQLFEPQEYKAGIRDAA